MAGNTSDDQHKSVDQMAKEALQKASDQSSVGSVQEEADKSDDFAQTLSSLQNLIEAKATKLMNHKNEMKQKREMIKSVFENDPQLHETKEKKDEVYKAFRERKKIVREKPEVKELKSELKMMSQAQKEIEESLSNHLINYHQLTNSTSFDTSDGDQWEFKIKAKVKNKKV